MRIIAGKAKGRKLETIEGIDTRPTLDRVKEAMFGSLQFEIPGASVLDLFAGSGALSLEAASRGAFSVIANDLNPLCVRVIKKNISVTRLEDIVTVLNLDYKVCIDRLKAEGKTFKIVFIDAPYSEDFGPDALERLAESNLILLDGYVVFEHARERQLLDTFGSLHLLKTKFFGSCAFSIYQRY